MSPSHPAWSVCMGDRVKPGHARLIRDIVFAGMTREPMNTDRGLLARP